MAKNPQLAIDALVKRLSLTPEVAKAAMERVYQQRPTLAEQFDPSSSHSMVAIEKGLVGKLFLAMQVLHTTGAIPEQIPLSVIQQSVDPQYLKRFAAAKPAS